MRRLIVILLLLSGLVIPAHAQEIVAPAVPDSAQDLMPPETESFGDQVDTLIHASAAGKSVTFPRPSYDGRWILYSYADFGNFPINHKEADLWLMDLKDGSTHPLERANSPYTESFHNWSSDSHWILFASRRGDSLYSCIYIAEIDENGNASKPFLLPQKDPRYNIWRHKSFNVPEFIEGRVELPKNVEKIFLPED